MTTETAHRPLTIAIDFDGTFSADPPLWAVFTFYAVARGHRVVLVTGRSDHVMYSDPGRHWGNEVRGLLAEHAVDDLLPVVFAGGRPKRVAALAAGYTVDIWIDDQPESVENMT